MKNIIPALVILGVIYLGVLSVDVLYRPVKWLILNKESIDAKGRPCYELGDSLQLVFCKDPKKQSDFDLFILCKNGVSIDNNSISSYKSSVSSKFGLFVFIDYQYRGYLKKQKNKHKKELEF